MSLGEGQGGGGWEIRNIVYYDIKGNDNESVYFSTREGFFWKSKKMTWCQAGREKGYRKCDGWEAAIISSRTFEHVRARA